MGVSVREKPKGSGIWWIFISKDKTRRSKKIGKDKKRALEMAKIIEAQFAMNDYHLLTDKSKTPIFAEYANRWINTVVPATCKRSTLSDYKGILKNHLLPYFGKRQIDTIKRIHIKEFLMKKYRGGLAQSTVTHIKNALSGVFGIALDDEVITANPAQNLGKIFGKKRIKDVRKMDVLSRDELSLLLRTCEKEYPNHYPLVLTLARTGMRVGEALALQWADIDFNSRFIHVQRGITRGKFIETPKNGKTRHVDMSLQLTETLWKLKRERLLEYGDEMPEWVFINSVGKPIDENNWRKKVFNKALEAAELRRIRVHDLRHTYASLLLQAGESMMYVRDQLGHGSIKVTVDVYGHLIPGANKGAVDRLDDEESIQTM